MWTSENGCRDSKLQSMLQNKLNCDAKKTFVGNRKILFVVKRKLNLNAYA